MLSGRGLLLKELSKASRKSASSLEEGLCVVTYEPGAHGSVGVPLSVVAEAKLPSGGQGGDAGDGVAGGEVSLMLSAAEAGMLLHTRVLQESWPVGHANVSAACFAAGGAQEGGGGEGRAGARGGQWREDWTCPSCEAFCFGSKPNCFFCNEPRPPQPDEDATADPRSSTGSGRAGGAASRGAAVSEASGHGRRSRLLGDDSRGGSTSFDQGRERQTDEGKGSAVEGAAGTDEQAVPAGGAEKRQRGERGGRRVKELKEKADKRARGVGSADGSVGADADEAWNGTTGCGQRSGRSFREGAGAAAAVVGVVREPPSAAASAARSSLLAGVRLKKS